ncbi:Ig-like domain-containing protein [Pediococcus acidilactici]|uniref:Ig-like domain-containing protein n=1 Tax=Pediococcus acidilactici TaxID=1254 RepID=UPI00232F5D99|nr:Ig-like domain-containing protein [Pediococcus acidilactici]MDB8867676.1 Ig-like domain-containing protein [Pediococcus acidilactici]
MANSDRTQQHLVIYKAGTKMFEGKVSEKTVAITGLASGTSVATGDYQVAWSDGINTSDKVDVPGFKVLDATVPVTGVALSQKTASMKVGNTKQVTATVAPENATNNKVTYASDNEAVATVAQDGTITAVSEGKANITVTTEDGGFTDTCAVTVAKVE